MASGSFSLFSFSNLSLLSCFDTIGWMAGGEFHVSAPVGAVRQSGVTLEKKAVKQKMDVTAKSHHKLHYECTQTRVDSKR